MNRPPEKERRVRLKWWCFRLLAVAFAMAGMVSVELLLGWLGCGHSVDLVVRVPVHAGRLSYQFNEWADVPYWGAVDLQGPETRRFELPKPPETYRIVVFGASTVIGFPFSADFAFPRQLELVLRQQAANQQVEVLNAGITSINSFALVDLVRQGLAAQPDLIIVHAGHNEFYGPGGAASAVQGLSPGAFSTLIPLKRLRLSQLLIAALAHPPEDKNLIEVLPGTLQIAKDSPTFRVAESHFRTNLQKIVDTATRAGVPVLLTTVACNLHDQGPIRSLPQDTLSPESQQRLQTLLTRGETQFGDKQWEAAAALYQEADVLAPTSANVAFRLAQCYEGMQRFDAALVKYQQARDLDGCRLRAPSRFATIVRDVAQEASTGGVYFCDTAGELQSRNGPSALGHNLFLEHVHYNLEGNWQIALILAEFVQTRIRKRSWDEHRIPSRQQRNDQLAVTAQDQLAADSVALQVLQSPPLKDAFDRQRQWAFLTNRIRSFYKQLPLDDQNVFAGLSMVEMSENLPGALAQRYATLGRTDKAILWCRRAVRRQPWSFEPHLELATALALHGQTQPARAELAIARELAPDSSRISELERWLAAKSGSP